MCGEERCEYFHHPSLHRYLQNSNENNVTSNENVNNVHIEEVVHNSHNFKTNNILFKIIPVTLYGANKSVNTFVFIDEGSSINLMDECLLDKLDVKGIYNPLCLRWTGGMERTEKSSQKLNIGISGGNKKRLDATVFRVKSLNLPTQTLDYKMMSDRYRHLRNLPVESYVDAVPMLLIGLNNFDLGISTKIREGSNHEPVAVCTKLGWLVYGTVAEHNLSSKQFNFHLCDCSTSDTQLEELVRSFYTLKSIGISAKDPLIADSEERD